MEAVCGLKTASSLATPQVLQTFRNEKFGVWQFRQCQSSNTLSAWPTDDPGPRWFCPDSCSPLENPVTDDFATLWLLSDDPGLFKSWSFDENDPGQGPICFPLLLTAAVVSEASLLSTVVDFGPLGGKGGWPGGSGGAEGVKGWPWLGGKASFCCK